MNHPKLQNKTVLFIGYVWPEPESSAAGRHICSLIECFLAAGCQVHFASPASKTDYTFDLASRDVSTHDIRLNDDAFNAFCHALNPDIVVFDRFMMEEQFGWRVEQACPNALRILDTEDLQFLRDARHRAYKEQRELQTTDLHSELALREIAAILRSDFSLIISSVESELLQRRFNIPAQQLLTLPFLVPFSEDNFKSYEEREHFVAVGNFRHAPNWDSVLYLKQLWPHIRAQVPDAELHIYGAYTPPKATALHNQAEGFLIKDRAQDVFAVIKNARVLLATLRFGAGIKGKLIDAMQMGTPSVTTAIGSEAMHDGLPWPGAVADTNDDLVHQAVTLYCDAKRWAQAQANIAPIMRQVFDQRLLTERLLNKVSDVYESLAEHRSGLFFNALLRHHTLRSTEFMSRWIALKNQIHHSSSNQQETFSIK